ncbi:hypothetical protein KAFR_0A00150 [Kazachstania africana CBS 2517]|uniref:Uncharacterized protein n=1 Tax=Kazachstania africana (strain ATCC 22294 / BCRC 22015 / CBS 2517 / CECT 1963 / NBRC 1671 / NRRL Y-8276) TaxID=1071382 RepID=H2AM53_KAZAF|nr:hypothetical protein KAFR_0A00150 [Kazachstania africana CBS 2517]CCF55453.1 hypothetical protein KAFR_0A00150 [Kazachstania africana CBS 2517]
MSSSKVIIVTGVSRGIGKAVVESIFSKDSNAVVYGIARTETSLQELKTQYSNFHYVVGEVTDTAKTEALVKMATDSYGKIDSIIANAGVLNPVAKITEFNYDDWKRHFDINFFSIVQLVSISLPALEKSRGNLIFVSSGASVKSYNGWSCYCAAKAALNSFAQSIAAEHSLVRSIAVAPGVVDTKMQEDIRDTFGPRGMSNDALKRFTDLKRNNQLLEPTVPAAVFAELALHAIPPQLNGKYVRYDDESLKNIGHS